MTERRRRVENAPHTYRKNDRTTNISGEAASCCRGSVSIDKLYGTVRSFVQAPLKVRNPCNQIGLGNTTDARQRICDVSFVSAKDVEFLRDFLKKNGRTGQRRRLRWIGSDDVSLT